MITKRNPNPTNTPLIKQEAWTGKMANCLKIVEIPSKNTKNGISILLVNFI
ncbi:MAG: hypothetical protein FWD48_11500 [Oscillospiraceae bacterium]|nr:hypothetical protein [Oscillospiraceae bacterium]